MKGRLSGEPREYFTPPGSGIAKLERFHISQAVRIGNLVEISGQSGASSEGTFATDLRAQIAQALDNVEGVLRHAGAEWSDVYSLTTYHVADEPAAPRVDLISLATIADFLRLALPEHPPLWTAVPVPTLAHPGMRIEIVARAAL